MENVYWPFPSSMPPVKTPKAKNTGIKFPKSVEEFSEGDKLLVRIRKEGKGWEETKKA
jgi:hypothetical protein